LLGVAVDEIPNDVAALVIDVTTKSAPI
jgi:hypothetical protein